MQISARRSHASPARRSRRVWFTSLVQPPSDEELKHHKCLQDLLDQRWRRWRSMIATAMRCGVYAIFSASLLMGTIPVERALDGLLKAIGVP